MRWPLDPPQAPKWQDWHRWFVWKPITVGRQRVWLEWVDRKGTMYGGRDDEGVEWEYRLLETVYA